MIYYVNICFDKKQDGIIIPSAKCEIGYHVDLNLPQTLVTPHGGEQLGAKARRALEDARTNPFLLKDEAVDVLEKVSGIKSKIKRGNTYQMVSIQLEEGVRFKTRYYMRDGKGNHLLLKSQPDFSKELPLDATDGELGAAILATLHEGVAHFDPGFFDGGSQAGEVSSSSSGGVVPFGYKNTWLAVCSDSQEAVISALGLTAQGEVDWQQGLDEADGTGPVFVTSVLDGFVLAIGVGAMTLESLCGLARVFSDVQYYLTHRVVDYHAWARFKDGTLFRAYSFLGESGEVMWDEGDLSDGERELGLVALPTKGGDWPDGVTFPEEEHVLDLAARWGIDPLFRDKAYPEATGLLCR